MKKMLTILFSLSLLLGSGVAWGQVNISAGNTINEAFTIGTSATATMPTGWKVDINTTVRSVGSYSGAGAATERIGGNSMPTNATNGIYNFGAGDGASATDRGVGGLSSSSASKSVNVYVQITNNGATNIENFTISYNVEKYRNGSNVAGFSIQMYYSTDGTTWTSAGSDFLTSFSADADNNGYESAPGATISISDKTLSQSLAVSSSIYLAWNYSVTSGTTTSNAQALGIDDVVITANETSGSNQTNTPEFSPIAGNYTTTQNVTISTATVDATIYYTTNGDDPNDGNTEYSDTPIEISSTTTLKAIAYADGFDPSDIATAVYNFPVIRTWTGGASTQNWADATNWSPVGLPLDIDDVILDNSLVPDSYTVILPSGYVTSSVVSLEITPDNEKTITLNLPNTNTANPGFSVSGTGDAIILNPGSMLRNSNNASAGSGIDLSGSSAKLRINNGGRYIHNTLRVHATGIVAKLSATEGTEHGIFEFDVPGSGSYNLSTSGRTYGTMILNASEAGSKSYTASGISSLNIRGDLIIKNNTTLESNMTGELFVGGNFEVENNAAVTFKSGSNVTITGLLTNNSGADGLIIQSTESGTASLIQNTADVPATIQRYVTGGEVGLGYRYHLLSIPLANNITAGDAFTGTYLWSYAPNAANTEEDPYWVGITDETQLLDVRHGFLGYVAAANHTYNFTGNLKTGAFISDIATTADGNFNLIPNPYPSAMDWDEVITAGSNTTGTIWFFESATGNYVSYNAGTPEGGNIIPIGQSVFVEANGASPEISFGDEVRVHNNQAFYKQATDYAGVLHARVEANNSADNTYIRFKYGAENSYNSSDDALKLHGFTGTPQLYTYSSDKEKLSINTLSKTGETLVILIGFELEADDEVKFIFEGMESFDDSPIIHLEDVKEQKIINLSEQNTYTFMHSQAYEEIRFRLHFFGVTGTEESKQPNDHHIWSHEDKIYIHIPDLSGEQVQIELYDLLGKQLTSISHNLDQTSIITVPFKGVVIARIVASNRIYTNKLFIR